MQDENKDREFERKVFEYIKNNLTVSVSEYSVSYDYQHGVEVKLWLNDDSGKCHAISSDSCSLS
jgi:hypothetical protein